MWVKPELVTHATFPYGESVTSWALAPVSISVALPVPRSTTPTRGSPGLYGRFVTVNQSSRPSALIERSCWARPSSSRRWIFQVPTSTTLMNVSVS